MSLTDVMLDYLTSEAFSIKENNKIALYEALSTGDLEKLKQTFHAFFASIPYHWYIHNKMYEYEGYYASLFYCYFSALGIEVSPEETTHQGRIDLVAKLDKKLFIIEFKVIDTNKDKGTALQQIKTKKYYQKYLSSIEKGNIYLIGVEFDRQERNIINFEWESLS